MDVEVAGETGWANITLRHRNDKTIALLERNPVLPGELGQEELDEFVEDVKDAKPASAARWLVDYLPRMNTIYAFQLLSGTDVDDGWSAVYALQNCIWSNGGGILQADHVGFSNDSGDHILWQFGNHAKGSRGMAVLNANGSWSRFEMNLGNPRHRSAFLAGRVPEGVKLL